MVAVSQEFNIGFEENGIEVSHFMPDDGSGVYLKGIFIPAGKMVKNHSHTFTHKSFLAFGEVAIVCDGSPPIKVCGPTALTIKQGIQHEINAITDTYWVCIHATNELDLDKIDHSLVDQDF